jgi:CRP/FNR family transcriptional regulator, cyclic AMP receptor protein
MTLPSSTSASIGERIHQLIVSKVISATTVEIARRDYLYTNCDTGSCLFLVLKGRVKVVTVNPDGKESLLRIVTPGDLVGESGLAGGQRLDSAIAMAPTTVKRLRHDELIRAMTDHGLRQTFVEFFAQRVCEQQQLITDLITVNSERRLASILLNLSQKMGHRVGTTLQLRERITQEELAAMVGTTRSRVGFFLKRFRECGILQSADGRLLVFDESRLRAFIEFGDLS